LAVFEASEFKRTLCGSTWESLKGDKNAFASLGSSTARYGCCPAGSFMSNPFVAFSEANSCSPCTAGKYGSDVLNDDTGCHNCTDGESSPKGSTICNICPRGRYLKDQAALDNLNCTICSAGKIQTIAHLNLSKFFSHSQTLYIQKLSVNHTARYIYNIHSRYFFFIFHLLSQQSNVKIVLSVDSWKILD
jgi:hypothetical protein